MRKLMPMFGLLVLLASLLAACGTTTSTTPTSAPSAAPATRSDVTLTYMASQGWIKDAELELAKKFEEETGIHIDYQIIPADQYFSVLQTRLNSNEGPDIFGGQSGQTDLRVQYDAPRNAVDLTGEEWISRVDPLSVAETTIDGKTYGLTIYDPGKWMIVYNKDIFADLGLEIPTNYEEFKAVSQAILDAGITPIYEPVADGWHHVMWFPEIGPRFEEVTPGLKDELNANTATFAENETMLTALTQLNELYTLGFFGDNALSDSGADTESKMASGEYAMTLTIITLPQAINKAFPEVPAERFGYFVNPLADNQILGVSPGGPSKYIYSGSPHIEEAKQYFRFLTQPENLQYLLDNEATFSTLNFTGITDKFTPEQRAFLSNIKGTGTVYQVSVNYVNPQWMDIGRDIVTMFSGSALPESILANIDQRRAEMATTAQDPAWNK